MKDDVISRQAAKLKVAKVIWEDGDSCYDFHDKCVDCLDDVPSAQPELARINDCNGCKFIGCYDTDFPCANCVRKDKDYYEPEG